MNVDEQSLPQDGRLNLTVDGHQYDIRVAGMPTLFGETVVMRILDQRATLISLDKLSFFGDDLARMRSWTQSWHGLILFTGPTGSGKTTTLYSCIGEIAGPEKNTVTVDEPVEWQLPYTRQTNVNRRNGLTFPSALRALMRQDPDVIMVGEIRDKETAEVIVNAALTGHLVLSTLHTVDSVSAALRLTEIGIDRFMVASCVRGILAQRLARKLCVECRRPVELTGTVKAEVREIAERGGFTIPADAQFYEPGGCEACRRRGYRGRMALYELLDFSSAIREAFGSGANGDELMALAVSEGTLPLAADGIRKAAAGMTTVDEVFRTTTKW